MSSPQPQQQQRYNAGAAQQQQQPQQQAAAAGEYSELDAQQGGGSGNGGTGTPPQSFQHPGGYNQGNQQGQQGQQQQQGVAQEQPLQQQQQPVNFNPRSDPYGPSRRVTIGGSMHAAGGGDRRGSLSSMSFNMDDFFGRRPSMGPAISGAGSDLGGVGGVGGGGMDTLFGRRDSMDSTSAALDAAIFDLTRRRYSMATGAGPGPNMGPSAAAASGAVPGFPMEHHSGFPPQYNPSMRGAAGMMMNDMGGVHGLDMSEHSAAEMSTSMNSGYAAAGAVGGMGGRSMGGVGGGNPSSIAARQQQLQAQQRELEQAQKELERQRQELISSMQQRNLMMQPPFFGEPKMDRSGRGVVSGAGSGFGMMAAGGGYPQQQLHDPLSGSQRSGGRGSLGLGSVHSHASSHTSGMMPQQTQSASHRSSTGSGGSQQWWICQVCNTKAFASHDEALAHEAICQGFGNNSKMMMMDNSKMGMYQMPQTSHHSSHMMDNSASTRSRNYSMGMDSSQHTTLTAHTTGTTGSYEQPAYSNGPFAMMDKPIPLAMPTDKDWLTPLHCFVRRSCVEVFTATESDVAAPSKGKRKPIRVGQVGIRCPHCHSTDNSKARERGSVYYPTTISSIYNATMNLLQRHLHGCSAVPDDMMRRYETLKADDARSGTSKRYWVESALSLGLVDTPTGIRFSALEPPPLPGLTRSQETMTGGENSSRRNSNEFFSSNSNAVADIKKSPHRESGEKAPVGGGDPNMHKTEQDMTDTAPLTSPEDKSYSTGFSYHLLSQMKPCVFTEADRLGKRKGLPPGFPGLACRHCFGGYGSGRFFPSSIKTLSDTSKTLNVLHNHMMRCRKCPPEVRETLEKLRSKHDEERAKMKFGSQKAFFARIWERLHGKDSQPLVGIKRKSPSAAGAPVYTNMGGVGGHQYYDQMLPNMGNHGMMGGGGPPMGGGGGGNNNMSPPPRKVDVGGGGGDGDMSQCKQKDSPHMTMPPQTGPAVGGLDALAMASDPKRQRTH